MITYLIIILWLFSPFLLATILNATGSFIPPVYRPGAGQWLESTNPYFLTWAPYTKPGSVEPDVTMWCFWDLASVFLAFSRLWRPAGFARWHGIRLAHPRPKRLASGSRLTVPVLPWHRLLPGPTLDGNPVFWREWYRSKPSPFMWLAWALYWALGLAWIVIAVQSVVSISTNRDLVATLNVFQVGVGLLLLSVNAATSLAEERMRGSLDVLLTTPLSTRSILAGKWAGASPNRSLAAVCAGRDGAFTRRRKRPLDPVRFVSGTPLGIQCLDRQFGIGAGNLAKPAWASGGLVRRRLRRALNRLAGGGSWSDFGCRSRRMIA